VNQKIATIGLGVLALVVVLVFLLLPGPPAPAPAPSPEKDTAPRKPSSSSGYSADFDAGPDFSAATKTPPLAASALPTGAAWEDRLDELLTAETDNTTTVRGLVSSMRSLPPEAQEEFVAHAVNLCEDEQFGMLAEIYYNAATPQEVSETIFNDALNRPDEIKLPLLAKTLRNPGHPLAGEAKEILEMYLDLEPGALPPVGWEQAVNEYLRQQGQ
jgi:hypothetical protein